jgi:hypothetical protein
LSQREAAGCVSVHLQLCGGWSQRLTSSVGRNSLMSFQIYRAVLGGFWVVSIVACVLAIRWSFSSVRRRFRPAFILSLSALAISFLGIARFHYNSTTTTNGVVTSRFDSRWLFMVSMLLGVCALVCTVWRRRHSVGQDAAPNSRPPSQLPASPGVESSDSLHTRSSGGCG